MKRALPDALGAIQKEGNNVRESGRHRAEKMGNGDLMFAMVYVFSRRENHFKLAYGEAETLFSQIENRTGSQSTGPVQRRGFSLSG